MRLVYRIGINPDRLAMVLKTDSFHLTVVLLSGDCCIRKIRRMFLRMFHITKHFLSIQSITDYNQKYSITVNSWNDVCIS